MRSFQLYFMPTPPQPNSGVARMKSECANDGRGEPSARAIISARVRAVSIWRRDGCGCASGERRPRNVRDMYQMSQPPHLYLQLNNPRIGNPNEFVVYRRMTGEAVHYYNEPVFVNGRDGHPASVNAGDGNPRSVHDGVNGYNKGFGLPRKNGYWVSKRAVKTAHVNGTSHGTECESDDSSVSSVTSNLVAHNNNNNNADKDNTAKKMIVHSAPVHAHFHYADSLDGNPRLSQHQQSVLFHHNKRRNHASRGGYQGRTMSAIRCHFVNPQPMMYSIAPDRFLMRAHLIQVRDTPKNLLTGSMWDTLSQNVWSKFMDCQQTEDTFRKKMKLWRFLYVSIKNMSSRYGLYLVGSTMSGFGADNSDMDLCLLVKHQEPGDSRSQALEHLNAIYHFIRNMDVFFRAELIQAKVPILKFRDSCFFLEVDLNCNNVVGIRNTHLLYCYSQLDWRVRPLVLIVKLWAQYNNINDAKNRTISSYSLVLMVIHFLQCGTQPNVLPCLQKELPDKFSNTCNIHQIEIHEQMPPYKSENNQALGELLYGFLQYYTYFEYSKYAISVRTGKLISVEDCRAAHRNETHQWKFLCVEEPFDLSNTARSVYDPDVFAHICSVFEKSKQALEKSPLLSSLLPSHKVH
ncbi:poly(A) RNA polymerase gld-2 homolog A-like [Arctopsyche grandis]|uniref:poly(A) RNA polymerase gld-2 homolog A-like n=1 Tax=Arctopsyche grandis TaxID=121162 RepID=UPI00406D8CCB